MVYVGASAMYVIAKRLKKRHSLTDDVRQHLYDACNRWTRALDKKKTKFLGGKQPNLADLSLFGALSSVEGSAAFRDVLDNTQIGTVRGFCSKEPADIFQLIHYLFQSHGSTQ